MTFNKLICAILRRGYALVHRQGPLHGVNYVYDIRFFLVNKEGRVWSGGRLREHGQQGCSSASTFRRG